jgi:hypothetical protein
MFIDTTNQIFLTRLHEEYEKVCQDCLEQVDSIKVSVSIHSSFYFFFRLFFQSNLNLNSIKVTVPFNLMVYCINASFPIHLILNSIKVSVWDYLMVDYILWKYLNSLVQMFLVSTKYFDSWVLEFVVSDIAGNNQRENCISLDLNFRCLSEPRNSWKCIPHD